jgi:hypothetical protein
VKFHGTCLIAFTICARGIYASVVPIDLGTAASYAVLTGSTVTNTGATILQGDLGVWPGTAITGFPPGILTSGAVQAGGAAAMQAQADLATSYDFAASEGCDSTLTGQDLGGLTLTPGVYCFASSAQLTGHLTLNAQGDPNALFLFKIGSTLTTAANSDVSFSNGDGGRNVDWQVGSSATLGSGTVFAGNILAFTSITLNTGADIETGSALARNGAVTMDTNQITNAPVTVTPEPSFLGVIALLTVIGGGRLFWIKRRREKSSTDAARL